MTRIALDVTLGASIVVVYAMRQRLFLAFCMLVFPQSYLKKLFLKVAAELEKKGK